MTTEFLTLNHDSDLLNPDNGIPDIHWRRIQH